MHRLRVDDLTEPRAFNLMFKTFVGPVEDDSAVAYLRPETAQGIFAQFANVLATSRQKVPFGIAQIGKAFRNEINPRNYTFRSREFEQMELEFFIKPGTDAQVARVLGGGAPEVVPSPSACPPSSLHQDVHAEGEAGPLRHRPASTSLYDFPFGRQELEGIAARGNFDLSRHQEFSGKSMEYFDQESEREVRAARGRTLGRRRPHRAGRCSATPTARNGSRRARRTAKSARPSPGKRARRRLRGAHGHALRARASRRSRWPSSRC